MHRHDNHVGSPAMPENSALAAAVRRTLSNPPYQLDPEQRAVVLKAIVQVCSHRAWTLLAAHVRSTHVHVLAQADCSPEHAMNAFKSYASHELNKYGGAQTKRWARHGSTVYLWKPDAVTKAVRYVIEEQGEPMAVYAGEHPRYSSEPAVSPPSPSGY